MTNSEHEAIELKSDIWELCVAPTSKWSRIMRREVGGHSPWHLEEVIARVSTMHRDRLDMNNSDSLYSSRAGLS